MITYFPVVRGEPNERIEFEKLVDREASYIGQWETTSFGTKHLQLYIRFPRPMHVDVVKDLLPPGTHVEVQRGTVNDAIYYCIKPDTQIPGLPAIAYGIRVNDYIASYPVGRIWKKYPIRDALMETFQKGTGCFKEPLPQRWHQSDPTVKPSPPPDLADEEELDMVELPDELYKARHTLEPLVADTALDVTRSYASSS